MDASATHTVPDRATLPLPLWRLFGLPRPTGRGHAATLKATQGRRPVCPRCACPLREDQWHLATVVDALPWRPSRYSAYSDPLCPVCGALNRPAPQEL